MTQYLSQSTLALLLFLSFGEGMFLSAVYDVFRIRRRFFTPKSRLMFHLWTGIEDLIFCILAAFLCSLIFYRFNRGLIRFAGLVGILPGFFLWKGTVSRLILCFIDWLVRLLRWILSFLIWKVLAPPILFWTRKIGRFFGQIRKSVWRCRRRRYTQRMLRRMLCSAADGFRFRCEIEKNESGFSKRSISYRKGNESL